MSDWERIQDVYKRQIGEKTAAKIIQEYHTVENAIAHAGEVKPPRAGKNLAEYADQARLSLKLATIVTDSQIDQEPQAYQPENFGQPEVLEFLKRYELRTLLQRFLSIRSEISEEISNTCKIRWIENLRDVAKMAEAMRNGFSYRLYEESEGIFGFWALAVCARSGEAFWAEEGKISREEILEGLQAVWEDPGIPKTGYDLSLIHI